jgi:hypothetical protein
VAGQWACEALDSRKFSAVLTSTCKLIAGTLRSKARAFNLLGSIPAGWALWSDAPCWQSAALVKGEPRTCLTCSEGNILNVQWKTSSCDAQTSRETNLRSAILLSLYSYSWYLMVLVKLTINKKINKVD